MKVITPIDKDTALYQHKTIFLAGSIEMGNAEEWQNYIIEKLSQKDNLIIYNPRRNDWDSSWEQKETNLEFNHQVNWELNKLMVSNIIFMYFSPNTKSPISLLELGLFASTGKMIVVCPDGFWRKGNVQIVCNRYNIPIFNTFEEGFGGLMTKLSMF